MHVMTRRPNCWTSYAGERSPWAYDRGASCGNAFDLAGIAKLLELTSGCADCARLIRAMEIADGVITPYPSDLRAGVR